MNSSIWENVKLPSYPTLYENLKTDVLIIGGGMCGILCAHFFKEAGIDSILVEANEIGQGITKNTTAKITSQHGLIYQELIKHKDREKAKQYLNANEVALDWYRHLSRSIDCDFEMQDSYVYSTKKPEKIIEEVTALRSLLFPAKFVSTTPLPIRTKGAIQFPNQAQFHPFKFIASLLKDLTIYEHTMITNIKHQVAIAPHGTITANHIIVATHFPFLNRHGNYFLKLYQERSYVLALRNTSTIDGMYVDESSDGFSFRTYNDILLLGGGGHRTGTPSGNWSALRRFAKEQFPAAKEVGAWATQDCMSLDHIPYIGNYSLFTPHLYVATGFEKWGMTSSMVSAIILRDMILKKENPWQDVFSPHRNMITSQLGINAIESTIHLFMPSRKRCPHMGCALTWNKAEHSWDCPCHGSRFDKTGELIDNPSKKSLK